MNFNFSGGMVDIVIGKHIGSWRVHLWPCIQGCGLNILNEPPVASLAQLEALANGGAPSTFRVERVTAAILAAYMVVVPRKRQLRTLFGPLHLGLSALVRISFFVYICRSHVPLYRNQIAILTTTTPHTTVCVESVTTDHGILRTVAWSGPQAGRYIDLQSDENNFDMIRGLIRLPFSTIALPGLVYSDTWFDRLDFSKCILAPLWSPSVNFSFNAPMLPWPTCPVFHSVTLITQISSPLLFFLPSLPWSCCPVFRSVTLVTQIGLPLSLRRVSQKSRLRTTTGGCIPTAG